MITRLLQELRDRRVPVGTQELVALAEAMAKGLHGNSLDQFYLVARAVLVHDEAHLDDFDQVFSHLYKGVPYASKAILDDIEEWLKNPLNRPELTDEEKAALQELGVDELRRMFEERLREQKERHDGGGYWIGTGGRSPFGTGGYHPTGISLRGASPRAPGSGGRSSLRSADARLYQRYRNDLVLDVRQVEVALRKLRSFDRDTPLRELDVEGSVDATARNFGELELMFRKPRRPNTRVILMMDVGGSMDPYAALVSQLFSAAKRATHWKELRSYYFHNCIYGRVYKTDGLREPVPLKELFRECEGSRYKLIIVGDASMASYELMGWDSDVFGAGGAGDRTPEGQPLSGLHWLLRLRDRFRDSVWLNPDGAPSYWGGPSTVEVISKVFPMFPLTLSGLEEGLQALKKQR